VPFHTRPQDVPRDWDGIFALFHHLWGRARDGEPYDQDEKRQWSWLHTALEREARRAGNPSEASTIGLADLRKTGTR
jgi:hypothetical protein